jgi:hypothetical protein
MVPSAVRESTPIERAVGSRQRVGGDGALLVVGTICRVADLNARQAAGVIPTSMPFGHANPLDGQNSPFIGRFDPFM